MYVRVFKCSYESIHGEISIDIKPDNVSITIPNGITAEINLEHLEIPQKQTVGFGNYTFNIR